MTLRSRFKQIKKEHPEWGDVPCLRLAIEKGDKHSNVRQVFNDCVDREDYEVDEKRSLLSDLYYVADHGHPLDQPRQRFESVIHLNGGTSPLYQEVEA